MNKKRKRVSVPTYLPARKAWYKWDPSKQKTVFVAGDVSADEALKAWQRMQKATAKEAAEPKRRTKWGGDGVTIGMIVTRYYDERRADAQTGKCSASHLSSIIQVCNDLVKHFTNDQLIDELTPDDWTSYARTLDRFKPSSRKRYRAIIMAMFRQADDDDWIDHLPKFGRAFKQLASTKGTAKVQPFTRDECQRILAEIDDRLRVTFKTPGADRGASLVAMRNLKAAFLLGLNGGYTPVDLGTLRTEDVDLENGFIRVDRHKTKKGRVVPLWAETIKAIRAAHKPGDELLLTTRVGRPLAHQTVNSKGTVTLVDSISDRFRAVMQAAGVVKPGKGLSRLRHTCRTVASETGDESAGDILAGHSLPGMRAVYVTVTDERLVKAAKHVHDWFFSPRTGG